MKIKEVIEQLESLLHEAQYNRACSPEEYMYQRDVEALESAINILKHIPIADVAPVVHAHWHYTDAYPHWVCCSNCGKKFLPNKEWIETYNIPTNYCPQCGSKMDEI